MYYLFIHKDKDIQKYKEQFNKVRKNMDEGKTPVYSELRGATTQLVETVPYNILSGCFLVFSTLLLNKFEMNELLKIAVVLVINNLCGCISNFIFTVAKHWLRIKLCKRLGIEPSEENIAVMESLEYQSV